LFWMCLSWPRCVSCIIMVARVCFTIVGQ
jgi:hypothetical protein